MAATLIDLNRLAEAEQHAKESLLIRMRAFGRRTTFPCCGAPPFPVAPQHISLLRRTAFPCCGAPSLSITMAHLGSQRTAPWRSGLLSSGAGHHLHFYRGASPRLQRATLDVCLL
jgi:hypothetical protein